MMKLSRYLPLVFIISLCSIFTCRAQLRKGETSVVFYIQDDCYKAEVTKLGFKGQRTLCPVAALTGISLDHTLYEPENALNLYRLILSPIADLFDRKGNIYYQLCFGLYEINLDALMDEKGKRFGDVYNLYRLSDIKTLPQQPVPPSLAFMNFILFGGMDYYADPVFMQYYGGFVHWRDYEGRFDDIPGLRNHDYVFGHTEDGTRAGVDNLKYSKGEIKFIYHLNKSKGRPYTSSEAVEELFKLQVWRADDYMVHISTHTFSMELTESFDNMSPSEQKDYYYRSIGLLFSGAGHTLRGESMPYGLNDGLLYAKEIADLDMSHCTLLVLAACNTALGVVTQDGFLGLQRAFKEAGVQTILMTLWSVNDKATSEFMKQFYEHLFSGRTKYEALKLTRQSFMKHPQFSDPIYWAPFVMLD